MAKYYCRFGNLVYTAVRTPEKRPPNAPIRSRKIRQKIWPQLERGIALIICYTSPRGGIRWETYVGRYPPLG